MDNIEEKLLMLGFYKNKYFNEYVCLIRDNLNTKKEKFKTQQHHIIPKCVFSLNDLTVDNSKENLINLKYQDHILAHYYLCLCCNNLLSHRLECAFLYLTSKKYNLGSFNPKEDLKEYDYIYSDFRKNQSLKMLGSALMKGKHHSLEQRKKWSLKRKGTKLSVESIEKIRLASKGRRLSEEARQKVRLSRLGKTATEKTKEKLKTSHLGHIHTKEEKEKIRNTILKRGLCPTQFAHEKSRLSRMKSVYQCDLNGNIIKEWPSVTEAANVLNINFRNISLVCYKKRYKAGGYTWHFKKEVVQ